MGRVLLTQERPQSGWAPGPGSTQLPRTDNNGGYSSPWESHHGTPGGNCPGAEIVFFSDILGAADAQQGLWVPICVAS